MLKIRGTECYRVVFSKRVMGITKSRRSRALAAIAAFHAYVCKMVPSYRFEYNIALIAKYIEGTV